MAAGIKAPASAAGWTLDLFNALGMKAFTTTLIGFMSTCVAYGFNYLVSRYPSEANNIAARIMNEWQKASGAWVLFAKNYMEQLTGKTFTDEMMESLIGNKMKLTAHEIADGIGKEFLTPMLGMIMPGTPDWDKIRADANLPETTQYAPVEILNPSDGLLGAERFLGVNLQFQLQAWMLHFIGDTMSMGNMKSLKDLPNAISWSYGIGWLSWLVMGTPFQITIADPLRKLLNMLYRPTNLTVAQTIDAWNAGYVNDDELWKVMREAGYQDYLIPVLVNQGTQRIPTGTLHDGYLLGRFDWATVASELKRTGYNAERIGWLKTVWELERHDDLLKKWVTESIDSFEKGFIDEETLRSALTSAGWEDVETGNPIDLQVLISRQKRMKQSQFTKAEMKELWAQGIITEEDLKVYLTRIGVTETNADLLIDLWGAGLIERDVMNLYMKGIIGPEKALTYLNKLDIQRADGLVLISLWDKQLALKGAPRPHPLTKYELREFLAADKIATPDAVTGLENIGYSKDDARNLVSIWRGVTQTEIDKLQDRIDELENPKPPTLTRTEVKQLFDKGLMNLQAVYNGLLDKGYIDADALLLTQLYTEATVEQIKGLTPYVSPGAVSRDLTVTEIKMLYENGAPGFDTLGALARMKGVGYSEADALLLIALWLPWYPPEETP